MHTLRPEFAQALQQLVREFNQGKLTNKKGLTQGPNANWRPMQLARTTENIDAATDVATPGSGTAELYIPDPGSAADIHEKGYIADSKPEDRSAGSWVYVAREINVTNPFQKDIPKDTFIIVTFTRGQWVPVNGSSDSVYIELEQDLGEPSTGLEASPPSATATILEFNEVTGKLEKSDTQITVINRGRGQFYVEGTRGYPKTLSGERHFFPIECDPGESSSSTSTTTNSSLTVSSALP